MRIKIYLVLFITSLYQLHSQNWCTPGSTWYYALPQPGDGYSKYSYLYDTIVGAQNCNKIKIETNGHGMGGFVINYTNYIYTYTQNGIVFKNNGTLSAPQYDTLYNFIGAIGTKWRSNPSGGQACAKSYIEITGSGIIVIQGQTLNYKTIYYENYSYNAPLMSLPQTGVDTLFERIGTRHQMEFITGYNCTDATDVGPFPFRCFSDYQINIQMSAVACDYTTGFEKIKSVEKYLEVNNPVIDVIHLKIKNNLDNRFKQIILIDQFGNKVIDTHQSGNEITLNVNNIVNGLYILQVSIANEILSRKIVIQNYF